MKKVGEEGAAANVVNLGTHPTRAENDAAEIAQTIQEKGYDVGHKRFIEIVTARKLSRWEAIVLSSMARKCLRRLLFGQQQQLAA